MKSPLSRESDAPHVHPRPRKRPPRCTLDCGFKTPESPALRGFVAERCPIRGTSLYLVLKSNGPHRSKNLPVKFGFSSKTVPANIAKKLPPQRCPKPLLIAFFNFSHKRPTFAFTSESGHTHSALGERSHTAAHTPKHGRFGWGVVSPVLLYTYISRFSVNPHHQAEGENQAKLPSLTLSPTVSHRAFQLLAQTAHVRFHE